MRALTFFRFDSTLAITTGGGFGCGWLTPVRCSASVTGGETADARGASLAAGSGGGGMGPGFVFT